MATTAFAVVDPTPLISAVIQEGAATLQTAVDVCAARGVKAEKLFIRESPEAAVIALGHGDRFDLIVLGTHGRHGVARAVLGSVAERILRGSDVPVLMVTAHTAAPPSGGRFSRALVSIDDSGPSRAALAVAAHLALESDTQLILCNVVDSRDLLSKAATYGYDERPFEADLHAAASKLLERARDAAQPMTVIGDLVVAEGAPAASIEHTAMQRNCDLIIIGTHARHGVQRLFLGSVAEAVIRGSTVPVLVVPGQKHQHARSAHGFA
jgi:nucleotide-binding universal stress UspA family protein